MKGHITTEKTVWCGLCVVWLQESARNNSAIGKIARSRGWKFTRKFGWICPAHNQRKEMTE